METETQNVESSLAENALGDLETVLLEKSEEWWPDELQLLEQEDDFLEFYRGYFYSGNSSNTSPKIITLDGNKLAWYLTLWNWLKERSQVMLFALLFIFIFILIKQSEEK